MLFKTNKKHTALRIPALVCMAALITTQAKAQGIDYSSYQELFGEPVTASANGSPQRQSEVALNMEILTAEEIKRTGARTIPEILRFVPGVDVRRHTFGQAEVGIRGYNQGSSERILVLVNGRQVYTDFFGLVVWDNIPVEIGEIKQIEVVKGPNTALFGFNAVSGVVNIITYNPLYDDVKEASVSAGTHHYKNASGVITHKLSDKVAVKLSGGGYNADDDFNRLFPVVRDETQRASVSLDVWGQLTDNVQAQFEVTHNDHMRNEYIATHNFNSTEYNTNSIRGRILADTNWGLIEADIYHNDTLADYDIFTDPNASPLQVDNRITVAKLSDTFKWEQDHTFRIGAEYREASNMISSTAAALDQSDLTYNIWSGSALWDWQATDKLRTSVAFRYDNFELEPDEANFVAPAPIGTFNPFSDADYHQKREEFSYNLGLAYQLDDYNTLRASASRGADLPSFVEFGLQFFTPAATAPPSGAFGDPNVDTSIVTNYEIGYDKKIEDINGEFRSAVFYQYNDEMQSFSGSVSQLPGPVDIALLTNIGDSEMYGVELGLDGVYKNNWEWFVNYTFVNIDDDVRNTQNAAERSSPQTFEDTAINHILNAHIGYTAEKWRADFFGQYRSGFDDIVDANPATNNELKLEEVNDQFIANANFSYDITDKLTWSVSGTSIFGKSQQIVENDAERIVWTSLSYKF